LLGRADIPLLAVPDYAMTNLAAACPHCDDALQAFCFPNTEVLIDGCKVCQWIWLDSENLRSIQNTLDTTVTVICPRCQTSNHYQPETFEVSSCTNCGILLKHLFAPTGAALTSKRDQPALHPGHEASATPDRPEAADQLIAETDSGYAKVHSDWETVPNPSREYQFCLYTLPAMLLIGLAFNLSGLGASIQRIVFGMPVHELGHALTGWFTGYNAIPTLWFTIYDINSRGLFAPLLLFSVIVYLARYAKLNNSLPGFALCLSLLVTQAMGTFVISRNTADMLITFGGDGMGMILATLLMASFYFGKNTNLYKGALRWGFTGIGAAAFVDLYSVWVRAFDDLNKVPYGKSGGQFTDSYKLVEFFGWSLETLASRYLILGAFCLLVLAGIYALGLRKAKRMMIASTHQPFKLDQ
jgi:hypothetical protein